MRPVAYAGPSRQPIRGLPETWTCMADTVLTGMRSVFDWRTVFLLLQIVLIQYNKQLSAG